MLTAIMLTRNEIDCIEEILKPWCDRNIPIVTLDASTDGTREILENKNNITVLKQEEIGCYAVRDGSNLLQYPLLKKRELYGANDFVYILFGDEIWYHDPIKIARHLRNTNCNGILFQEMFHFIHISQKELYDFENHKWKQEYKSMYNQMPYYSQGWLQDKVFFDNGTCNYLPDQVQWPIPWQTDTKRLIENPIVSHFPMRTPKQFIERQIDRVKCNFTHDYEEMRSWEEEQFFTTHFPHSKAIKLDTCDKYDNGYGKYEKGLEFLK